MYYYSTTVTPKSPVIYSYETLYFVKALQKPWLSKHAYMRRETQDLLMHCIISVNKI